MNWQEAGMLIFLGWMSWIDIKTREVPLAAVWMFGLLGAVLLLCQAADPIRYGSGILWGSIFLFSSYMSRGAVGAGDGWLILALAAWIPGIELAALICLSLFFCSLTGAAIMLYRRKKMKMKLPFIPFLMAGALCRMIF